MGNEKLYFDLENEELRVSKPMGPDSPFCYDELIITKEAFVMAYNRWIKGEEDKITNENNNC